MNKELLKKIILIFTLLTVTACGNKTRNKVSLEDAVKGLEVVAGVGFKEVFDEVLSKNCLECHSSYSNYQLVANQSKRFLDAVLTGRMPKGRAPLTDRQKSILKTWVDQGSPEVASEVSKPIELAPNYESLFVNIIGPKCLVCHTGRTNSPAPPDVNFSTYATMMASNEKYKATFGVGFLDQEAGEESEIIFLVTDPDEPMPPIAIFGNDEYNSNPIPKLEAAEVQALIDWIKKGFPEK